MTRKLRSKACTLLKMLIYKINTRKDSVYSEFIMFTNIKICSVLNLVTYKTKHNEPLN